MGTELERLSREVADGTPGAKLKLARLRYRKGEDGAFYEYAEQLHESGDKNAVVVHYSGSYPNTCSGELVIVVLGAEMYRGKYEVHSTGSVWFDDDYSEHVETGELLWDEDEAKEFPEFIREAVRRKLSEFHVCCGGCV